MKPLASILLILGGIVGLARLTSAAPADVTRVLRTIDFEERRLGNFEDLPMHWQKIEGPGFPHYVNGLLATDRHHGGQYSFRFDLNGGSLMYRYAPGQIAVQSGAHYRVEVYCCTTVLPYARARLSAYMTDQDGHPISQSVRRSALYAASQADDGWTKLSVDLSADDPKDAFLVVELALLQPAQYAVTSLGDRALFEQDINGSAWFDDMAISQVPVIAMSTDRPGNVFRAEDPLRLKVDVSDKFTDDLSAQLVVTDAEGNEVYQLSGGLDANTSSAPTPGEKRMQLRLPTLKPGWYEAKLTLLSGGQTLGGQVLDLVRLADDLPPGEPDPRFGINALDLPFAGWSELPDVLPILSAGRVKLAVWSKEGDIEQVDPIGFDHLLQQLQGLGIMPTACLVDLPPAIRARIPLGLPGLPAAPPDDWQPELAYLVSRHANHLDRWQFGADGTDAFVTDPRMRSAYDTVYRSFSGLIAKPDLAMPWPAWYELQGKMPATVALSVPPSVLPAQLPLYIQDLQAQEGTSGDHNLSLSLQLLDRQEYGREAQIRDLAQRVIYCLAAGAQRIDLPLPFTVVQQGQAIIKEPQELLMIYRTLIATLGNAKFEGNVPLGDGIEAFLFDRDGEGVMAIWDRGSAPGVKRLPINFGARPVCVDLWGNVTQLLTSNSDEQAIGPAGSGLALTVGPMPIFLIDIDGAQAQLRASVSLDRPLIESSFEPHMRKVRFTNPYKTTISGTMKLKAPRGWTLNPPTFTFSLNPGEAFDRDVSIQFPYNSYAGMKTIQCEFNLEGESNSTFTVPLSLRLGLTDVGMQSFAIRDGPDLVVQQTITNYGENSVDYTAFVICPGNDRQERLVTALDPGHTTLKRYRFKDVNLPDGSFIRAGMKELQGTRILNEKVPVQ
jgi:hypothetical protein